MPFPKPSTDPLSTVTPDTGPVSLATNNSSHSQRGGSSTDTRTVDGGWFKGGKEVTRVRGGGRSATGRIVMGGTRAKCKVNWGRWNTCG